MKRFIGIGCLILVLSIALVGCSINVGVRTNKSSSKKIYDTINIDNITSINIKNSCGSIEIKSYEGKEIKIEGKYNEGNSKYTLEEKDNKLDINCNSISLFGIDSSISLFSNGRDNENKLVILIPEIYDNDISISSDMGKTNVIGIKGNNIIINAGAGELKVEDVVFKKLDLDAGVGSTKVVLSEKCGDINVDGGVGDVDISIEEVGGNFKCENGIGEVQIRIPYNAPVKINKDGGVGDFKIDAKTSGEDLYIFDLNVGIGEIRVYN